MRCREGVLVRTRQRGCRKMLAKAVRRSCKFVHYFRPNDVFRHRFANYPRWNIHNCDRCLKQRCIGKPSAYADGSIAPPPEHGRSTIAAETPESRRHARY